LGAQGISTLCGYQLQAILGRPQAHVSQHLARMKKEGLVEATGVEVSTARGGTKAVSNAATAFSQREHCKDIKVDVLSGAAGPNTQSLADSSPDLFADFRRWR
jgi:DNA-binding transcriptional ArsR family regulator